MVPIPLLRAALFRGENLAERQAPFFQTDEALLADDEMIEHFNVEQFSRRDNAARDRHVFGTASGRRTDGCARR